MKVVSDWEKGAQRQGLRFRGSKPCYPEREALLAYLAKEGIEWGRGCLVCVAPKVLPRD